MDQVYRIEIPIEAINETDASALRSLETALQRIFTQANKSKSAAQDAMDSISSSASGAASSMKTLDGTLDKTAQGFEKTADSAEDVGTAGEQAANEAGAAADKLGKDVEEVAGSYKDTGKAAKEAGQGASSAFNQAGQQVDKFTQRTEKSQQSLRKMFAQKLQLTLAAIDKVSPILKSVGSSLKNLTAKAWHIAVRMTDLVTAPFRKLVQMITSPIAMTLSLAGVGLGASSFLSTFTEFSAGMSNVKALTGATAEEFDRLNQTAETLGATTKFTAAEASEGMQYLAMAGWDTNQIIEAMPGLLDLAAAGATDLGTAADIVSDVMTAMGMSADQASTAADIFARTATMTNTTISMMGESLKYAAPIAHSFGLSLSEVSTMVGMMGNAGIKASQAGTAIRSSLLSMASPSKEAADLMKQLGLSFSNADGSMKNMGQIIGNLQEAFAGLTAEQRLNYAETLFGTMASSAWLGMIDQGADEYNRLYNAIDNSTGAAKEMSEIQLDNLQGDMTRLQSAVDGMKISLMKQLDPYLRKGVQWLTGKIPMLTEKVGSFVTKGIEKATELKNFLQGVFTSADFQNADGFADKFFVAWDKIIAEPFSEWWDGNGQNMVLGIVKKVGSGMGQMYHGIISGIFAALKGEEIDFDGLNLTGLAKAGAQAAKSFIDSFKESFDLGGLFDEAPGLLKAGLLGFGALKIGGGALGVVKTIGQIKTAFVGVKVAAGAATTATTAYGASAAAGVAGTAKFAAGLTTVKAALAAIPVWGWVAAAALAAVVAGVSLYNKAQEDERQSILHMGDAVESAVGRCKESAAQVNEALDLIESIKEIELKITENKGGNQQVIEEFKKEVNEIQNREVWITAKLAQNTLTPEEITAYQQELEMVKGKIAEVEATLSAKTLTPEQVAAYQTELDKVKGRKAEVEAALSASTLTAEQVTAYQSELEALKGQKAEIMAALASGTLTAEQVLSYQAELEQVKGQKAEVEAALASGTLTEAQVKEYQSKLEALTGKEAELNAKLADSSLTPEQVAAYQGQLEALKGKEAEINAKLAANSLTAQQVLDYQAELDALKGKEAELSAALASGTLTASDVASYQAELETLKGRKVELEAALASGTLTKSDIDAYQKELDALHGNTVEVVAKLNTQGYSVFQAAIIAAQLESIEEGEKKVTVTIAKNTQLTPDEIANYVSKLSELMAQKSTYELMIQGKGLTATEIAAYKTELDKIESKQADIEVKLNKGQGTMTDAQWNSLVSEAASLQAQAADIQMVLKGSTMNDSEIATVKAKLGEVRGEAAGILLNIGYSEGSTLKQTDLDKIVADLASIGDVKAQLEISLSEGSLSPEELENAATALDQLYNRLAEMSGGAFTAEDLKSGAATTEQVQEFLQARADKDIWNLATEVETARQKVPEAVKARDEYQTTYQAFEAQESAMNQQATQLKVLEEQRQGLVAEAAYHEQQVKSGAWTNQQLWDWYDTADETIRGMQDQYKTITGGRTAPGFDFMWSEGPVITTETQDFYANYYREEKEKYLADYETQNASLKKLYSGEKDLMERQTFNGTSVAGYSLEELASQYNKLDDAGKAAFASALAGLDEINAAATYLSETDKVDIGALLGDASQSVTISANIEVVDDVKSKLTELSTTYQTLNSDAAKADFNADNLEAVNAALEALGLEKIDSLADLSSKLQEIAAIDPSGLDFTAAAASLEALGGDATSAKDKVAAAKAQLDALAGTYNVTIKYNVVGSIPNPPATNAEGGIYDGAFLSWVAEDGPEAIIPLGNDKRGRGLDLWMQAGRMLGVNEFADGGIMAPYAGAIADLPDFVLDDEDAPAPIAVPTGNSGGKGQQTIEVSIDSSPTFEINGGSPDDIMAALKSHMKELAELLGTEFAEQISDIVLNIA